MEYILTRLDEIKDGGSTGLWLGVSDSELDGTFVWVDGVTDANRGYKRWGPNQPFDNQVRQVFIHCLCSFCII